MSPDTEQYVRNTMSGAQRGLAAGALRLALSTIEPFYAGAMILRNRLYDAGLHKIVRLSRPVISIGNLTTGGTGKTPMVRWLAQRLRQAGRKVGVLSRGYRSAAGQAGDEQIMLDRLLNGPFDCAQGMPVDGAQGTPSPNSADGAIVLQANPNRSLAADAALRRQPGLELFLLDDGFQHRRIHRDLDIVLLSAADPFGFGHVLPRGMLREPIGGLRRAGAIVITHADQADESKLTEVESRIRRCNGHAPIYRAIHALAGLRTAAAPSAGPADRTLDDLRQTRFFAFCGIGNPGAFQRQLESIGAACAGSRWFADHHAYSAQDLATLRQDAAARGAAVLLTTEKDWVKVAPLAQASAANPEIWRMDVEMQLAGNGAEKLLEQVMAAMKTQSGVAR